MFELHLLGGTDLRAPGRDGAGAVLAQPKRLALLATLALAGGPGGMVRRDTLLALFWPDSDTDRARNSLRQALFFLRRELGPEWLAARGAEEVGLAAGHWRLDVADFRRALADGRRAEALALYRGDLLAGFNLGGLPEWERWLAGERERLRAEAAGAAWALADAAVAAGDAVAAAGWARRAVELTPGEEEPLRRLLRLLDRLGDRGAAVRAYERFARELAEGWELTPSRETRALVAEIRGRIAETPAGALGAIAPQPPPLEPAEGAAPVRPAERAEPAPRADSATRPELAAPADRPRPPAPPATGAVRRAGAGRVRRWGGVAALALAGAALAGGALWLQRRPAPALAATATPVVAVTADRIAILPFVVRGPSAWDWLGEGLADLLAARLDGLGTATTVDVRTVLATVDGEVEDPAVARDHAARLGASGFALGRAVVSGDRVQLRAGLYRLRGVRGLLSNAEPERQGEVVVEGATAEMPRLVDELTARLTATRLSRPGETLDRDAALTTRSLPALRAFLRGSTAARAGHFSEAVAALRSAVATDSTFALAWYRLALTENLAGDLGWTQTGRRAQAAALAAVQRGAPALPAHGQALLAGLLAEADGRLDAAAGHYAAVVAARPTDAEAARRLAEAAYHGGPQRGVAADASRARWERVLALDPTDATAVAHLARLAAHRGDRAAVDALTRRGLALEGAGDRAAEHLALRDVVLGDTAAGRRVRALLARATEQQVLVVVVRTADATDAPRQVRDYAALLLAPERPRRTRLVGHLTLATLELAAGRVASAAAALDAADALEPDAAWTARVALDALPWLPAPAPAVRAARLRALEARVAVGDRLAWSPESSLGTLRFREVALANFGFALARAGAFARALAVAETLDTLPATRVPPSPGGEGWPVPFGLPPASLAAAVRAHVAWLGGPSAGEATALARAWRHPRQGDETHPLPPFTSAHLRFLRAERLRRAGRDREALAAYEAVFEDMDASVLYAAPVHRGQAELLERLGRPGDAAAHWRRVADLWADADPALQPLVAQARARAARGG